MEEYTSAFQTCIWMMGRVFLLVVCVLGGGVAWLLYSPLPPGIADPGKVRVLLASMKVLNMIVYVGEKLGMGSSLNLARNSLEWSFGRIKTDPRVLTSEAIFDGVRVKIYRPVSQSNNPLPALVYYHGGGWVTFTADSYGPLTSYLAAELGWVVVSVDYRLAPEHPYPAPFNDCLTATTYLLRNTEKYHIDKSLVGVAGDSAGGNLAAAVALKLAETRDIPPIRFQGLIYPVLQSFDFRLPSYVTNDNATPGILSAAKMVDFWSMYFNGRVENQDLFLKNRHTSAKLKSDKYASFVSTDLLPTRYSSSIPDNSVESDQTLAEKFEPFLLDKFANPLMAEDLSNLPPTYVFTGEHDVLRDEGFIYVRRLTNAGLRVKHIHYPSGYHGFFTFFNHDLEPSICRQAIGDFVDWLQQERNRSVAYEN